MEISSATASSNADQRRCRVFIKSVQLYVECTYENFKIDREFQLHGVNVRESSFLLSRQATASRTIPVMRRLYCLSQAKSCKRSIENFSSPL